MHSLSFPFSVLLSFPANIHIRENDASLSAHHHRLSPRAVRGDDHTKFRREGENQTCDVWIGGPDRYSISRRTVSTQSWSKQQEKPSFRRAAALYEGFLVHWLNTEEALTVPRRCAGAGSGVWWLRPFVLEGSRF